MKLSKISQICKKHSYLQVFVHSLVQWISVGGAAYPMYCVPTVTKKEQLLALLDIPADSWESYTVDFLEDPGAVFDDLSAEDIMLEDSQMLCHWRGRCFLPLFTKDARTYWINERYLHPVSSAENPSYALRKVGEGLFAVAVFEGMSICAVIGIHIAPAEVMEMLRDALDGDARATSYGHRISKEMIEKLHGYQIPVVGVV